MTAHFITVCQFGQVHGQCRCPSKDKTVRKIVCNIPGHAQELVEQQGEVKNPERALKDAIVDLAKAAGVTVPADRGTVNDYLVIAHEAELAIKQLKSANDNLVRDSYARTRSY